MRARARHESEPREEFPAMRWSRESGDREKQERWGACLLITEAVGVYCDALACLYAIRHCFCTQIQKQPVFFVPSACLGLKKSGCSFVVVLSQKCYISGQMPVDGH